MLDWRAKDDGAALGPPKFCPNADLLWELLCDPAIGRRPHRWRAAATPAPK
jgi:hypothetical protein